MSRWRRRPGPHERDITITRCDRSVEDDLGMEASADDFRDARAGRVLQARADLLCSVLPTL
jgi:hypothetical protein